MVSGIQGSRPMGGPGGFGAPAALTEAQTTQVKTILAQYKAEDLSTTDAQAIFKSFREAGIRPGPGLREAIEDAGFDAEKLRALGRPEGERPPQGGPRGAQGQGQGLNKAALQSLQSILSQYDLTNLTDDQEQDLLGQLGNTGLVRTGYMLDLSA